MADTVLVLSLPVAVEGARHFLDRTRNLTADANPDDLAAHWLAARGHLERLLAAVTDTRPAPWTPPLAEDIRADKTDGCDD